MAIALTASASAQPIHMAASATGFTDGNGIVWAGNTCTGWLAFANPGTYPNPIYTTAAYTSVAGIPITCTFTVPSGLNYVLIHFDGEPVKTFNAGALNAWLIQQ